ncbi:putative damage-inducible protein DinB [Alicyclobacillus sacchari]|uniref:Putative damage-inducible protein DinB n=1 Tax=Alicyclobacillus sacchari TaxID=392010 RepID=A0A4R8LKH3_9BACL|nr:DinB family protein [Alicyclobacillus sacchari]TDY43021.1 putative damage-inducible protein DinB [Alicyclobacillus sacchari]GMA57738.1 hypothetical protein GCM10025858_22410 [Alicyclobacillus sacchari]
MTKAESYLQHWHAHRDVLFDLLKAVDEQHVNFQPWAGAMSFADLIWHIVSTGYFFADSAALGHASTRPQKPDLATIGAIESSISEWTQKTHDRIASITDEQFANLVDLTQLFGAKLPVAALLQTNLDHEIHHKGQLFVYARLCGADPLPFFVQRG